MGNLVPVQGDPFAQSAAPTPSGSQLVPVQGDPFSQPSAAQFQATSPISALENGAAQGMTMGFGDELFSALLGAPTEMAIAAYKGDDSGKGLLQRYAEGYDRSLHGTRDLIHQGEEAHPVLSTTGNVVGGLGAAGAAQGAGATLLNSAPSVTRAGAEAAAYMFANGMGNSENDTPQGKIVDALTAVPTGLATGAAVGAAGRALPAIENYITAFRDPDIGALSKPALDYARRNITPDMLAATQNLGEHSTLADVSPEWLGVARGAASVPDSRGTVVQPLLDRQAGANQRLAGDLNASLGPVTPPSQINTQIDAARQGTGNLYGPLFANAGAVDTSALANSLDTSAVNLRGPAQDAVRQVRGMLNVNGVPGQLDPHPGTLFQTRQAIDGMLRTETNPQAVRQLTMAREQVNAELQRAVPGIQQVDSQYAQIMGQRGALEQGGTVLDSGKTAVRPDDLRTNITQMAQPTGQMVGPSAQPLRLAQGARAEIDRTLGTAANDPVAFQRLVKGEGDWNRDKLAALFGEDPANQALAAGDREATFNTTTNRVASGSDTGMTAGFRDELNRLKTPTKAPTDLTVPGIAAWIGSKGLDMLRTGTAEQRAQAFADQLGRLSVTQGPARDRVVNAIMANQNARIRPLDPGALAIYNALVQQSGKLPAIAQAVQK